MSVPTRVLVCDDQALVRTGLVTIIDAQPDMEAVGECGTAGPGSSSPTACAPMSW